MTALRTIVVALLLAAPEVILAQGPSIFAFGAACPLRLGSLVCQVVDTSIAIQNTSTADDTVIAVDLTGNTRIIQMPQISLPSVIPMGSTLSIPIHCVAALDGQYIVTVAVTVRSGNLLESSSCGINFSASSIHIFSGFVFGGGFSFPYPCADVRDTAAWITAPACEDMYLNSIRLKSGSDFSINTSAIRYPDTLHRFDSGSGAHSLRIPLHFGGTKPGKYYDSILWEGSVEDGTSFHTGMPLTYVLDSPIDLTPKHLTNTYRSFNVVSSCTDTFVTFIEKNDNLCQFTDTISNVVSQLSAAPNSTDYSILHLPNQVLPSGAIDSLVIRWPFGATVNPPRGSVAITYRHGLDSSTVKYYFDGAAVPCPQSDVEAEENSVFSIRSDGNQLLISTSESSSARFELQNLLGATILSSTFSGSTSIDDRSLAPGVYVYRVTIGNRVLTGKITLP